MSNSPEPEKKFPRPRFRIRHLLILMALVGPTLWLLNESTLATAEIEVLAVEQEAGFYTIRIGWIRPQELSRIELTVHGVLPNAESSTKEEITALANKLQVLPGKTTYRYRKSRLLWIEPDSAIDSAIQEVNGELGEVEEAVVNFGPPPG